MSVEVFLRQLWATSSADAAALGTGIVGCSLPFRSPTRNVQVLTQHRLPRGPRVRHLLSRDVQLAKASVHLAAVCTPSPGGAMVGQGPVIPGTGGKLSQ